MNSGKNGAAHYMPLSASALKDGLTGPSHCVFSSPKGNYSKETEDFVKVLMKESKLTHTQRSGFQALLRSGKEPPETWSDSVERRRDYLRRRAARGRALGLNLDASQNINVSVSALKHLVPGEGRRSLDSIKASGVLELPNLARKYVPFDKELEKARFSYKMAYGHAPNRTPVNTPRKGEQRRQAREEKSICNIREERYQELVEEMKDRVEFLKSMELINRDKVYRPYIVFQIREKLAELRTLFPLRVEDVVSGLGLKRVDPTFAKH